MKTQLFVSEWYGQLEKNVKKSGSRSTAKNNNYRDDKRM